MKIYDRIYEQCQKHEMTGKELGIQLGLKKSPMTDWKNKQAQPTVDQIIKMCEIFAVTSEYLLFGKIDGELTPEEEELLEAYREADQKEKNMVRRSFGLKEITEPGKSSKSKIG